MAMPASLERSRSGLHSYLGGPGTRLIGLGFLALILLIPLSMIEGQVNERGQRRDEAMASVGASWGQAQSLSGPLLRFPYTVRWREDGQARSRSGWLVLTPERLEVDGGLDSQLRRRGIFEVPLYRARLRLRGHFRLPDPADLPIEPEHVDFGRADVLVGLSHPAALAPESRLRVAAVERKLDASAQTFGAQGVHARLSEGAAGLLSGQSLSFEADLVLQGSGSFHLAPVARENLLALHSNWPHPAFDGAGLPVQSEITAAGFTARWSVSHLGRGFAPSWLDQAVPRQAVEATAFGVNLAVPVDPYRMAERISKYAALLVALSFGVIWVMEMLGGRPMHAVQYLLIGASLCLFGLVQLALAEHLGFALAFCLAATAVVGQASLYTWAASGSRRRAAALGAVLGGWFVYLYVVLQAENLAFVLGALALFLALSAAMWATRRMSRPTLVPPEATERDWDVADATLE